MSGDDQGDDLFAPEALAEGLSIDDVARIAQTMTPALPPSDLRDRVMRSIATGGRLHRFADSVARALDVAADCARALLDGIDEATSWAAGPLPGVALYDVRGGPLAAGAITGFIRLPAGASFPEHSHLGSETVLVVQGRYRDSGGSIVGPGELVTMPKGSSHSFEVEDGADLVYLVVAFDGVRIGDRTFLPGDPDI
jgi:mannose-6-phosphate isomerase-like protein (cupin superfamily)